MNMGIQSRIGLAFNMSRNSFYYIALPAFLAAALLGAAFPGGAGAQMPGWQAETRLTNDEGTSSAPPNNAKYLAVDHDGVLHVVWLDDRDRNFEIYHRMRIGGIWEPEERLSFAAGTSARPNLAVDGSGIVHLAWNDNRTGNMEMYHRFWIFGAWSRETQITDTPGDSFASALAAVGDTLHMVYTEVVDSTVAEIMHRTLVNTVWSPAYPVTNVGTGKRMVPTMDRGPDGSIHVAWWDTRVDAWGDGGKIYYAKRSGNIWLDEELVTDPSMNAMRPSIAVDDSGFVHVAWIDARGDYQQIYYRRRGPAGWESETAVTHEPCIHYHPSIDTAGDEVFLVYWDSHVSDLNSEVFFKRKAAGAWWGPTRISDGESSSDLCCILAEPNKNLHVAWVDMRDGNREIYYRGYIDPANGTGGGDGALPPAPVPFSFSAHPNPFRGSTSFTVSVGERCAASIVLYTIDGRRVRSLERTTLAPGSRTVVWDGRSDGGAPLAPGIYIAVARAGKASAAAKILHLR
jgi:hypothetical protein